jgi:hypothetical protein
MLEKSLKVTFEYIGEGYCGDYDPNNPQDKKLLRFTVWVDGEQVTNGSYCTLMPVDTDPSILQMALDDLFTTVLEYYGRFGFKAQMQELSWMCPDDYKEGGRHATT